MRRIATAVMSLSLTAFIPAAFAHEHEAGAEHASNRKECKAHFKGADRKACRACVKQGKHHFHKVAEQGERCHVDGHAGAKMEKAEEKAGDKMEKAEDKAEKKAE